MLYICHLMKLSVDPQDNLLQASLSLVYIALDIFVQGELLEVTLRFGLVTPLALLAASLCNSDTLARVCREDQVDCLSVKPLLHLGAQPGIKWCKVWFKHS
jgi:hypothetical protein